MTTPTLLWNNISDLKRKKLVGMVRCITGRLLRTGHSCDILIGSTYSLREFITYKDEAVLASMTTQVEFKVSRIDEVSQDTSVLHTYSMRHNHVGLLNTWEMGTDGLCEIERIGHNTTMVTLTEFLFRVVMWCSDTHWLSTESVGLILVEMGRRR
ncbi:hypothetical protein Tco_0686793 [Tanacetum coccineum]